MDLALDEIKANIKHDKRMAFNRNDLKKILGDNRREWMLRSDFTPGKFIYDLVEAKIIKEKRLGFLNHNYLVYVKEGAIDIYELASKVSEQGYFSHLSAVYLHELTMQIPKTIYLSIKQPVVKGEKQVKLDQDQINNALQNPAKLSKAFTKIMVNRKQYIIYQLYGHIFSSEEIDVYSYKNSVEIKRTSLERTLIDIAIRPEYAGGIEIVREAYQNAQEKVSVNRLNAILSKMKTAYPYHQIIGFWMEICGNYTGTQIDIMRRNHQEFDFFLLHEIPQDELKYHSGWRVYYPSYLQI